MFRLVRNATDSISNFVERTNNSMDEQLSLRRIFGEEKYESLSSRWWFTEKKMETGGLLLYSLVVGSILDFRVGLRGMELIASRGLNMISNVPLAPMYSVVRNAAYRVTKTSTEHGQLRQFLPDAIAFFVTFSVPYAAITGGIKYVADCNWTLFDPMHPESIAAVLSSGSFDWNSFNDAIQYTAEITPFLTTSIAWVSNRVKRICGFKTPAEKVDYLNGQGTEIIRQYVDPTEYLYRKQQIPIKHGLIDVGF